MLTARFALALTFATACIAAPSGAAAAGFGLSSLYGCDAPGSSNTTGAVVGGLVGALAGSQISKNERALGAVIGAGIGSAIGNNLGCRMDRQARVDAQTAFQRALETGKTQGWSDPQSGATGTIRVVGPGSPTPPAGSAYSGRWRYAEGIAPAQRVGNAAGGDYVAGGRVNVRAAPNASAPIVDRLQAGEHVSVAGAVSGGWLAVVEDGLIQGYVALSVVRAAANAEPTYGCRLVEQTVSVPGQQSYSERFNACRDSSGAWRLDTV